MGPEPGPPRERSATAKLYDLAKPIADENERNGMRIIPTLTALALLPGLATAAGPAAAPDYAKQIRPLLQKYCVGCHAADEPEGKLSLESFSELLKGGRRGAAVVAGDAQSSRLFRMLNGTLKPSMPPADSEQPSAEEIELMRLWIEAGARGPDGAEPDLRTLVTPELAPASDARNPILSMDWSPTADLIAVGRFQNVELRDENGSRVVRTLTGLPGKVTDVVFNAAGSQLVTASGITGLKGEAALWDVASGRLIRSFTGHRDILYAVALSPDGRLLATAGYDRIIRLWNTSDGSLLNELSGHNGAVYDLDFHPDGAVLASASADETVKLWRVSDGQRLDTLSQPLKEQYSVQFSPNGRFLAAAGADNRIRVWRFVSRTRPRINPLIVARFAHEGAIVRLCYDATGKRLVSVAEDHTIKIWDARSVVQVIAHTNQPDSIAAVAVHPQAAKFLVGRMDGTLDQFPISMQPARTNVASLSDTAAALPETVPVQAIQEVEPNNSVEQPQDISLPAEIAGTIHPLETAANDVDVFRFEAQDGEQWVFEINAARSKSPLDSRIEIVDEAGQPIPRVLLRAVRDSYFTFRGKDSTTSDDYRLHNWQEMELNEYLYADGEVVKLWLYPRGPDSGYKVYPGRGSRWTYFDTTPTSHALNASCYIVEPYPPGSELPPNGLPTFTVYYENDDDARRELGSDSRLLFTAPTSGQFCVRVRDARDFGGADYRYKLTIRPRQPDFQVTLGGAKLAPGVGSGQEFNVTAKRKDNFEGPIDVHIKGLPDDLVATTPLTIEAEQTIAFGTLSAVSGAEPRQLTPEELAAIEVTAQATIRGKQVVHPVQGFQELKIEAAPKLLVRVLPDDGREYQPEDLLNIEPVELTIAPGETITARVQLIRNGFDGDVQFGKEDSGRNLPHGIIVDNIGLNGLMIFKGQNERQVFLSAADWVPETTRTFHLMARTAGNQTSFPVRLRVKSRSE